MNPLRDDPTVLATLGDEWPEMTVEPETQSSGLLVHYVLPLRWSLYFALTKTHWRELKNRHKTLHPDWGHCYCPKRCKANTLDENWRYEDATHTKVFLGAKFICPGCHWLKSIPWRMETWVKQQNGLLPPSSKPPHIIDCLDWTQQQVDALRERDLKRHQAESTQLARIEQDVKQGKAAVVPSPIERLSPQELAAVGKPGQVVVMPWRVDLSALVEYGYSSDEIAVFEQRMYELAAKRMEWG